MPLYLLVMVGADVSKIARWSYTERASVRPYISRDGTNNQIVYGEPYEIWCDFEATAEQHTDNDGNQFVSTYLIYTEDSRPAYMDEITLLSEAAQAVPQEIKKRTMWPMSAFKDVPDYRLVT